MYCGVCSNFAWKDRASDKWEYQGIVVQHPSKEAAPGAHSTLATVLSSVRPQFSEQAAASGVVSISLMSVCVPSSRVPDLSGPALQSAIWVHSS